MKYSGYLLLSFCTGLACVGTAQTGIDLRSQGKNVDFSGAQYTKPFKTGTVLPAVCSTGDFFFKSDAAPGQNIFGCVATNTWAVQSGAQGSLSVLPDVSISSPTSGQFLVHDSLTGTWKNKGVVGGASGAIEVNTSLLPIEVELNIGAARNYLSTTSPAADSIPRAGATGKLAAEWIPTVPAEPHAASHKNAGADEIGSAIPAANAIPKANSSGKLATGWLTEQVSIPDLADYDAKSGTGTTAIGATIASPQARDVLRWSGSNWVNQADIRSFGGGWTGSELVAGANETFAVPYACTIQKWWIHGNTSGSAVVDLLRAGSSIIGAGNKPTISSGSTAGFTAASGWTSVAIAAEDVLTISVTSTSNFTKLRVLFTCL